ncbi:MAG: endonuclease/exonuclease/phosphatase family protein, partial [Nocardioides sp.]|nr:endonuclease/exonuclease/phosphatase family protein [Nocardioides sp.]
GGVSTRAALTVALVVALACRTALQVVGGGAPQLWVASIGVAAVVTWWCVAARELGDVLVAGSLAGVAVAATTHAALGTWAAVWRADVWAWLLLLAQAALVVVALRTPPTDTSRPASRRQAVVVLPGMLLAGMWAANPARATAESGTVGAAVVVAAALLAVGVALAPPAGRFVSVIAALCLVVGTTWVMVPGHSSDWQSAAYVVGMPALAVLRRRIPDGDTEVGSSPAPAFAAGGGALLWVILLFVYYAGYDLGYRADLLLVAVAVVIGGLGVAGRPPAAAVTALHHPFLGIPVLGVGVAAALLGPLITVPASVMELHAHEGLRVMAWNLRMGYGMDGTFDVDGVARTIAAEEPDVVLLSEVDRGWLLNGGQDQLALLGRTLDLDVHFGPAADPVWGDAILTRLPVDDVDSVALEPFGAVTGAQVLAATVSKDDVAYEVLSTHVQPHEDPVDGSREQAMAIADYAQRRFDRSGNPVVFGGDFNLQPGDPSWDQIINDGFVDALSGARPLMTSPADAPEQQIDHVFASGDLHASDPGLVPTELSDHLPVLVTVYPLD